MSQPQLIVLNTAQGIKDLEAYLADKDLVAFDIETTGVHKGAEVIGYSVCADPEVAYYVITKAYDKATTSLIDLGLAEPTKSFLNTLKSKKLICHNGIFDCSMIEIYYKVRLIEALHTDTMVLAHLLDENRRVGLKELAKQYFGEDSTKEQEEMKTSIAENGGGITKDNYELYKGDATLIAKYGAKDALLTYNLFLTLVPELFDQGLDTFFYDEESMPLLRGPSYDLNTAGLKLDAPFLTSLKKTLEAECMEAKSFIYAEITSRIATKYPGTSKKNTFNMKSNQQMAWLLFGEYELEFGTLTDSGKEVCKFLGMKLPYTFSAKREFIAVCQRSVGKILAPAGTVNGKKVNAKKFKEPWAYIAVDKKTLAKLAVKYKWIERLLEYNRKNKILNTYIAGLEEKVQYGIIYPSFLQHGTTSGRYSSRHPNFQNLPRDDKRIKESIIARPGKVFVGADYSQLEPRVFAFTSNDQNLLNAFKSGEDFYSAIGMRVYGKYDCTPFKDDSPESFAVKYKKLRENIKVLALASTYGATPNQLAPTMGKSIEDTAQDMADYFEQFPDVAEMMKFSHRMAKKDGQVTNLFGRPRRIPEAKKIDKLYGNKDHSDYPYEIRSLLNLACNHRIQSTAASIVNRSAIHLHNSLKQAGIEGHLVAQVHDSLVIEVNEFDAKDAALLLQNSMENAVDLKTIKLEAIPKIGRTLADV